MTASHRRRPHRSSRIGLFAAAALAVSTLAACGTSDAQGTTPAASGQVDAIADMVPESVAKKGKLVVAAGVYPPAVIEPVGGGEPTGWDIENARQIADVLGLDVEVKIVPFDGVITGLQANRFDAAVGEIYITDERTDVVTFVSNHLSTDSLLVKADSDITSAENKQDLCGRTVAAQLGSAEAALIEEIAKECTKAGKAAVTPKTFKAQADVNVALSSGRVDAALSSASQVAHVINQTGDQFRLVEVPWAPTYKTGMALARGNDSDQLAKAVQAATDHLIENGALQKILDKFNRGQGLVERAEILPAPSAS